eukprot:comp6251_c0_seq2/m.2072 comp6251_c0_seq2/g.2072  ORF comp6251_c0_seq2/g.2072 comp6251_c0_seq2/m.2072 type:complete len:193 (-) comp6251_c0_seq2:28-606(-)
MALFVASVWWIIIPPLKEVYPWVLCSTVLFQELFRWLFFMVLVKSEQGLKAILNTQHTPMATRQQVALVGGLGFGVVSILMQYNSVLTEALGPGTLRSPGCPNQSFFLISALTANVFTLLNIVWMVIGLNAYDTRNWALAAVVLASHLFSSLLTLINRQDISCAAPLTPLFLQMAVLAVLSYVVARRRLLEQ